MKINTLIVKLDPLDFHRHQVLFSGTRMLSDATTNHEKNHENGKPNPKGLSLVPMHIYAHIDSVSIEHSWIPIDWNYY